MAKLRQDPVNPAVKIDALLAGRNYAAMTRRGEGYRITVFDEVALSNDIQAACAAAPTAASISANTNNLSIEQRLERLQALHAKNLISESEYQSKRAALRSEL